jgi:hypothetical protein
MRRVLNQVANAAVKAKGTIFAIVYRRLVPRLGHAQARALRGTRARRQRGGKEGIWFAFNFSGPRTLRAHTSNSAINAQGIVHCLMDGCLQNRPRNQG